ncbi:MAP kinase-interacting serine/threonine-protein kinase 1 [Mortierella claussenii]|nr:MAP kinase-interacting serine/threonine-protein kinase 1 [Mortierella claussenii]
MSGHSKQSPSASSGASSSSNPTLPTSQSGSWFGMRPVADNTPAISTALTPDVHSSMLSNTPTASGPARSSVGSRGSSSRGHKSSSRSSSSSSPPASAAGEKTGFKIRIPRDLPNIPDVFRKRAPVRSLPSSSPSSRYSPVASPVGRPRSTGSDALYQTKLMLSQRISVDNGKRGHSDSYAQDSRSTKNYLTLEPRPSSGKKTRAIRSESSSPNSLKANRLEPSSSKSFKTSASSSAQPKAKSNRSGTRRDIRASPSPSFTSHLHPSPSLALDSHLTNPVEFELSLPSSSTYTMTIDTNQEPLASKSILPAPVAKRLSDISSGTKVEPESPALVPIRFPTPTSLGGGTSGELEDVVQEQEPFIPMELVASSEMVDPVEQDSLDTTVQQPAKLTAESVMGAKSGPFIDSAVEPAGEPATQPSAVLAATARTEYATEQAGEHTAGSSSTLSIEREARPKAETTPDLSTIPKSESPAELVILPLADPAATIFVSSQLSNVRHSPRISSNAPPQAVESTNKRSSLMVPKTPSIDPAIYNLVPAQERNGGEAPATMTEDAEALSREDTVATPVLLQDTAMDEPPKGHIIYEKPSPAGTNNLPATTVPMFPSTTDMTEDLFSAIELVRLGTTVLDRLLSNPDCHNFVSKIPPSATSYHAVIKKPMDLTTIEHKLWRSVLMSQNALDNVSTSDMVAAMSYNMAHEGYAAYSDFERDLGRIYQNAAYFNSAQHPVHKDAKSYRVLYLNLLDRIHRHVLVPPPQVPQEQYTPSLISLSEPGPLYLFRAHQVREMERKMTDVSVDIFAAFHRPLLDVMYGSSMLSPETPKFARLYINKNRSLLYNCRDEKNAKIAILSDLQIGKPFTEAVQTSPGGTMKPGTKMVNIRARAMIAKPIGDRHDITTVGDLDCPSTWIMVACVRALDLDTNVPAKFEKGTLSKLRHEIFALTASAKLDPEYENAFLAALGLQGYASSPEPAVATQPSRALATAPSALIGTSPSLSATSAPPSALTGTAASSVSTLSIQQDQSPAMEPATKARKLNPEEINHPATSAVRSASGRQVSTTTMASEPFQGAPTMTWTPASTSSVSSLSPLALSTSPSGSRLTSISMPMDEGFSAGPIAIDMDRPSGMRPLTAREQQMLRELKIVSRQKNVPYLNWNAIEPTLTVDSAQGLFKRIYHVQGNDSLVVQNFKEMDAESFEQRVREVACLLKLRGMEGVGQIQSIIDDEKEHLVGLSMTKYAYTLKAYATNARRHPSPRQKLCLIQDMVAAISVIHNAGLAHRDLSEVNIMVDEDTVHLLEDKTPRPLVRVIDFGKSVFVEPEEVKRWSMKDVVPDDELALLPLVVLPPDHGYKLYRSILTLPRTKFDHTLLPPVDPRLEDVYSLGVLIWRTFSGKSPWNGAIEDDIKTIRYLVNSDEQIKFQLEREITGKMSRELLLKCLTAEASTRWTAQDLNEWLKQPEVLRELLSEFEALGGGRKRTRKNLD